MAKFLKSYFLFRFLCFLFLEIDIPNTKYIIDMLDVRYISYIPNIQNTIYITYIIDIPNIKYISHAKYMNYIYIMITLVNLIHVEDVDLSNTTGFLLLNQ